MKDYSSQRLLLLYMVL